MTKTPLLVGLTLTIAGLLASPAVARNEGYMLPIRDALDAPDAKAKLDRGIRLHFGGGTPARVAKDFGVLESDMKGRGAGRNGNDRLACEEAFVNAVLSLQERARSLGGNAVINITSNYRKTATSSPTQYMCRAGSHSARVALTGRVVRVGGN